MIEAIKVTIVRAYSGTPSSRLMKVMRKRVRVARQRARSGGTLLPASSRR